MLSEDDGFHTSDVDTMANQICLPRRVEIFNFRIDDNMNEDFHLNIFVLEFTLRVYGSPNEDKA